MKGKVAIITASSTGIGKSIADQLGKEGVKLIISSRNIENVNKTVEQMRDKGYEAHGIVCHVGKEQDREKLISGTIEKYGRIDFLVPNAAVSIRMQDIFAAKDSELQKMFDINYKSTFFLIKSALPHLKKQKGSIVIMSTFGAYELPNLSSHYSIIKLMLVGMTKIMSRMLIEHQVRVNCVCPGLIRTNFSKFIWEDQQYYQNFRKSVGFKRIGQPEEVSTVVKFLLSDQANYVNGEAVVMAGRPSARL